ncbi:MAG: AraC family transcriptional regulator [Acidobacteriota bacterium]
MNRHIAEMEWLVVRPYYCLAYADLAKSNAGIEQLSLEYTILHMASGNAELSLNRRVFTVATSGYAFITPGKPYLLRPTTSIAGAFIVKIQREMIVELATQMQLGWNGEEIFFRAETAAEIPALGSLCTMLQEEVANRQPGQSLALDALVTQIVIVLLRTWLEARPNSQLELSRVGLVDRRLRRAIEYIHAHYHREVGLAEIADAAFLSEFHFARLFKRITGLTPHQYLAVVRIEESKRLLANTDLAIATISSSVGYASQSHFTKVFRSLNGFTPAEYRELLRRS